MSDPHDSLAAALGLDAAVSDEELMARALDELERRREEQLRLEDELGDTNRGVVALYAELDDRAERLRAADEAKSRFLSAVSHELRSPLNSILALARLLEEETDGALTAGQATQVTFIRRSAEGTLVLVNNLLDLARIEAGRLPVSPQEFAIDNVFSALRGAMQPLRHEGVELIIEPAEDLPNLVQDEAKVVQILRNFVSNALKYTERGYVRVAGERLRPATVVVRVTDTGIGIDREDQERIFDEFIQLPGPLQTQVKGSGLGLALSRGLAGLLGGRVGVESEPGAGSTFWVELPIRHPSLDPTPAGGRGVGAPAQRVLVVDDEPASRYVVVQALRADGLDVVEASGGLPALARARDDRPDIIVLDLAMPDLDGFAVLARLAEEAATASIPVVIYSSQDLTPEERVRLTGRAAAILPKTNDGAPALRQAVRSILEPNMGPKAAPATTDRAR